MTKPLVLTVGNEMMGDDAAGPLLARMLEESPLEHWQVLDGGTAPENYLFKVREMHPEHVIIVDAAEMDLEAGEIRRVDRDRIGDLFLMTTHSLPLNYLMEAIEEIGPDVQLIGIQPGVVAFGCPPTPPIKAAVERLYAWLALGDERLSIPPAIRADANAGSAS